MWSQPIVSSTPCLLFPLSLFNVPLRSVCSWIAVSVWVVLTEDEHHTLVQKAGDKWGVHNSKNVFFKLKEMFLVKLKREIIDVKTHQRIDNSGDHISPNN